MPDVVCLGEALIDLFPSSIAIPIEKSPNFIAAPGGAPANVAVALARLGVDAGFIGRVGDDAFGAYLLNLLTSEGVNTAHFCPVPGSPTTLAVVVASSPTERDFILYRMADTKLRPSDLNRTYIASAKILLYGSVTLSDASRDAAVQAVEWANKSGTLVAYDANLRPALWPSLEAARCAILKGLQGVSICKLNEIELELLAGTNDLSSGSRWILDQGPKLCLVTLGEEGAYFNNGLAEDYVSGFQVPVIDTTGCGDAFLAGMICGLLETSLALESLDKSTLLRLVTFANAVGALTATRTGAMEALPTRADVNEFLKNSSL